MSDEVDPLPPSERTVSLSFPARPDYLVLARLVLSALCRLVPFGPDDAADLKLAVTEGASNFVAEGSAERLTFTFVLEHGLRVDIAGARGAGADDGTEDASLSRAIIAATVDESAWVDGRLRLVKRLPRTALNDGQ